MMYANMSSYFAGAHRLLTFEHPEWDGTLIEESIQVSQFLGNLSRNFMLVKDAVGIDLYGSTEIDFFTKMGEKLGKIKHNWDAMTGIVTGSNGALSNVESYDIPMELSDEDWLRDLLQTWNE
jgi:hypothetical protein